MNPEHHGADPARVDLELLADYAGGALDGTSAYHRVRRLVETQPEWATALGELRAADTLVRSDLAGYGREPTPMPPDMADRLQSALRDEAPVAPVVSLEKRRRRFRLAAASAVAASVVAIGSAGYVGLLGSGMTGGEQSGGRTTAEDAAKAPEGQDAGSDDGREKTAGGLSGAYPVVVSGRDYQRDSLPTATTRGEAAPDAKAAATVPPDLERLKAPDALSQCLTTIRSRYAGRVDLVEFARFEGSPALIVVLTDGAVQRVVVAGPDCGLRGPDLKHQTTA